MPDTVKITFNLHIKSTVRTFSIVNNVGKPLVKKSALMLRSQEIDTINNADISDTYKDLYLSEKEREAKRRFAASLNFDFFKHPVYPYGLKEIFICKV